MASTLPDIPSEIISNILTGLPVKSLMRFRCVSKSWHALVSHPNFIDTHLTQTCASSKGHVLVHRRSPSVDSVGDKFSLHCDETLVEHMELKSPLMGRFNVVGYCHGVLCLSFPFGTPHRDDDIYLWNPAFRKLKTLPKSLQLGNDAFVHLAFGFVPRTNDYKVLKFSRGNFGLLEVEIYSLRTNSWERIQSSIWGTICYGSRDPILNGVVHCVCKGTGYFFVLSFDLATEVFGEMKIPECCYAGPVSHTFLMVLRDSLHLVIHCEDEGNERLVVWAMKEYGSAGSWTKQFSFDKWLYPSLLGFMKNGEVVLRGDDGELLSYDPRVQQVKDLRIHGDPHLLRTFTYYMESLVLLN